MRGSIALYGLLLCTCSDLDPEHLPLGQAAEALTADRVEGFLLSGGGGLCPLTSGNCWMETGVYADGRVVLRDVEGAMESVLSEGELSEFLALVRDPLFVDLISASALVCPRGFDTSGDATVTWESGANHEFPRGASCFGGGSPGSGLVFARLGTFLSHTLSSHRVCSELWGGDLTKLWDGRSLCL